MGRGESHFNVPLIVRDKVTRQCGETTIFEEKGEPKRIRTKVPLLTARPKRLTDSQVHDSGPLTATFIAGGGYTPPVARITCCNTTPPIALIHRTNKTISVSLTNANSKRDGLVFLSLISFPLHNSNTRVKIPRAKIQPLRGKMDNSLHEKA